MLRFLKDNIVGTVILVTGLIWVPVSCIINWLDHKRAKEAQEKRKWEVQDDFVHLSNDARPKKVIYIKVPINRTESTNDEQM